VKREVLVEIVAYCLMPNHFHLVLKEEQEGGVSKYMSRIQNSYTKYVNTKYDRSGHLFEGPYKSVHVQSDDQLIYLSAYVHKNPIDIHDWRENLNQYPWSSFQDYIYENRWGKLLNNDIVMHQFDNGKDYEEYVKNCPAKELEDTEVDFW
jgi:putative transposase